MFRVSVFIRARPWEINNTLHIFVAKRIFVLKNLF